MLEQHAHAISQVLNHVVLQSVGLQPERVPEGGEAAAQQAELGAPVEALPVCQEHLAVLQLGLPLLAPVGAQPPWHDQADQRDQPQVRLVSEEAVEASEQRHGFDLTREDFFGHLSIESYLVRILHRVGEAVKSQLRRGKTVTKSVERHAESAAWSSAFRRDPAHSWHSA